MCHQENINAIGQLPIDYMGFIFYDKSPRWVKKKLNLQDLNGILKIGVFVNETNDVILRQAVEYDLDMIQLHGNESPEQCVELGRHGLQVIKAFALGNSVDLKQVKAYEHVVDYFLFDTKGKQPGGTGKLFDWSMLKNYNLKVPFFLSGGIHAGSAHQIRSFSHPMLHAIDINSRFEVRPGIKSELSLKSFIDELRD